VDSPSGTEEDVPKKGHDKPTITGAYQELLKRKEEEEKREREERQERLIKEIMSKKIPKTKAWDNFLELEAQLEKELSQTPTPDIAS